jgi:hypothetical protein
VSGAFEPPLHHHGGVVAEAVESASGEFEPGVLDARDGRICKAYRRNTRVFRSRPVVEQQQNDERLRAGARNRTAGTRTERTDEAEDASQASTG